MKLEGGVLNFMGGIYCKIHLDPSSVLSIWGDEVAGAKVETSVNFTYINELVLNGSRMGIPNRIEIFLRPT